MKVARKSASKKTFKEYFLEGLMIFLAVSMGFIAENIRESVADKEKEKDYIVSLIADLKVDIKNADTAIYLHKRLGGLFDSLLICINNPELTKQSGSVIYYAGRLGPRMDTYVNNTRTFNQLNGGGFRLIQNLAVSNRIVSYYEFFPHLRLLENKAFEEQSHYQKIASSIFDPLVFKSLETSDGKIVRSKGNPALLNYSPPLLKQLSIYIVYMNGSRYSIIPDLMKIKLHAQQLIDFLQHQYKLK